MAMKYPYDTTPDALYRPVLNKQPADFFQNWGPGDLANLDLLCAELSRLAYGVRDLVEQTLPSAGLTLAGWIGDETFTQRIQTWGTDGFVACRADGATFVVFRGTESGKVEDILADLRAKQVPAHGGKVHEGFQAAYAAISAPLAEIMKTCTKPLVFTGHSLGAAVATLAASAYRAWQPTLVTFGSPRVGDAAFADALKNDVTPRRYVGCCDIVTRVPPEALDQAHLQDIFEPFLSDGLLADGLAATLPTLLNVILSNARYQHAGEAHYIDQAGTIHTPKENHRSFVDTDQQAARDEYSDIAFSNHDFLGFLKNLIHPSAHSDRVPFRDLADHAPINYVSAFTGRQ
jgi:hypothetical protein